MLRSKINNYTFINISPGGYQLNLSRKQVVNEMAGIIRSSKKRFTTVSLLLSGAALIIVAASPVAWAGGSKIACDAAGPQAPRDVTKLAGSNAIKFAKAPPAADMNLCNIHFHRYAEHRASGFMKQAGKGIHQGYVCNGERPTATHAEGDHGDGQGCGGIAVGDTVEVHWVYTSCDVKPGPTLGSCLSDSCTSPQLRVEARVFRLSDDKMAGDFGKFTDYSSGKVSPPAAIKAVSYPGSTTGNSYNDGTCSPFKVTWNVSSACTPLSLKSINAWCGKTKNAFKEYYAHGVRKLVTDANLLSAIK